MDIANIASSAVIKIALASSKKLAKKGPAPVLPRPEPTIMKNSADDFYEVGYAWREVMPADITAKPYWLAGYRTGNKITGVLDPLTVRAMWIGCKDNGGIIMVSADCIGLTGYEVKTVRDSLKDFSDSVGCKSINICCTHTHASIDTVGYWGKLPKTGKDDEYMRQFLAAIKDICIEAYESREEGKLYYGCIAVPQAIKDGREPLVCNENLTRLRFVPQNGGTETWFLNFGAHPNTLGGSNSKVSADYPYFIREKINETVKTNVLFGVNAIAGVNAGGEMEDRFERTKYAGEELAKAAFEIENDKMLSPEITVLQQPYYTPIDNAVLSLMVIIKVCSSLRATCNTGSLKMALQTEMTYIKLGEQQILLLPGEAMPEFVYGGYSSAESSATGEGPEINPKPLVDIAGDKNLLVFGVTNDMTGYMVPPNDFILHPTQPYLSSYKDRFGRNHYHETNSLGYLTTKVVADTFADVMSRVK